MRAPIAARAISSGSRAPACAMCACAILSPRAVTKTLPVIEISSPAAARPLSTDIDADIAHPGQRTIARTYAPGAAASSTRALHRARCGASARQRASCAASYIATQAPATTSAPSAACVPWRLSAAIAA